MKSDVHVEDRLRLQEIHDEDAIDVGAHQHIRLVPFELFADHRLHRDLRRADHAFEQPRRTAGILQRPPGDVAGDGDVAVGDMIER